MMPANAVDGLRQQGIVASATPYRTSYLRLGPSIATTPEQVDAAIEAVSGLVYRSMATGTQHSADDPRNDDILIWLNGD